jgi:hypothetical protein
MKKVILVFGLVLGTILCVNMVYMVNLIYTNSEFKGNEVAGYAAMVVILSLIFFGIRNYRNKHVGGVISFGKAFKMGAMMVLLASTMYVLVWVVYYYAFVPDFMERYTTHVLEACQNDPTQLEAKTKELEFFSEMYKNPIFVVLLTYMEVLPVGLVVALISALILRRKEPVPA